MCLRGRSDAVEQTPADAFADSGLVELLALPNGSLPALERSFSIGAPGRGYTCKTYDINLCDATNVRANDVLSSYHAVEKELPVNLGTFGVDVDNIDAITFGPSWSGNKL